MNVSKNVALLGFVESITWYGDKNKLKRSRFKQYTQALTCTGSGKEIYLLPCDNVESIEIPKGLKKEENLYRRWSNFTIDSAFSIDIPTVKLKKIGSIVEIDYVTDKWTGKKTHYRHLYEDTCYLYGDRTRIPRVWGIKSSRTKVIVNERGLL